MGEKKNLEKFPNIFVYYFSHTHSAMKCKWGRLKWQKSAGFTCIRLQGNLLSKVRGALESELKFLTL